MKKKSQLDRLKQELSDEREFTNYFTSESAQRAKAFSIVMPLISQWEMTKLLAELSDLREYKERLQKKGGVKGWHT